MGVTELRQLRQLEEENRKLKQLVADLSLDKHMLQEVGRKKAQSARASARAD
jgi:putative transposase